jgi:hypothetical protein
MYRTVQANYTAVVGPTNIHLSESDSHSVGPRHDCQLHDCDMLPVTLNDMRV